MDLDKYFVKSELIPAVIQEHGTKKGADARVYE